MSNFINFDSFVIKSSDIIYVTKLDDKSIKIRCHHNGTPHDFVKEYDDEDQRDSALEGLNIRLNSISFNAYAWIDCADKYFSRISRHHSQANNTLMQINNSLKKMNKGIKKLLQGTKSE